MDPIGIARSELERLCQSIGAQLADSLRAAGSPAPLGFALLLFELDAQDGLFTSISNVQREDLIEALEEFLWTLSEPTTRPRAS